MTLEPGQRLGRYELLHPAGHGGMATVWMARLTGTRGFQKPVAIKTMLPAIREDPDAEKMFLAEAAVASRIRHPNVVEILDLGEESGVLYLVMEWIYGEPLGVVLAAAAKRGGMPLSLAVRIGTQTCAALHAAHELTDDTGKPLGVVHRDVSPHNVLAGFDGVVKLVDFGIAKVTSEATHLTEIGMVRGKIPYMAPEQIRLEKLDRRTDVFAAGILLYQLTTGRHPFKRNERNETALAICDDTPVEKPTSFLPSYPERLERVVLKALEKEPGNRYATAQQFGEDLARTMPPVLRGGDSQEALQQYLRDLLPERLRHHADLMRRALAADTGVFAPMAGGRSGLPTAQSSSTLRAVSVSEASGSLVVQEAAHSDDPPASDRTNVPARKKPGAGRTMLAVAAGAVAGAVAIVGLTSSRTPATEPHGAFAQKAPAAAPAAPQETAATPAIASAAPFPTAPDAGLAAPTPAPAPTAVHRAPKAKLAKRPSTDHAAGEPPNTGTVLKDPYGP
jgi:serine/threonine protein kinase